MFESRNICDLGLLQNARTHCPRGTVKTIEKYVFYIGPKSTTFCSGNSNQDPKNIIAFLVQLCHLPVRLFFFSIASCVQRDFRWLCRRSHCVSWVFHAKILKWVCLKIGYIPNYSHLIGIMISKTIGFRGTNHIFRHTQVSFLHILTACPCCGLLPWSHKTCSTCPFCAAALETP